MHMKIRTTTIKTTMVGAMVAALGHLTVKVPQVIGKRKHEVLFQHFSIGIFNISISNCTVQACILVQDIVARQLDFTGFILKKLLAEIQVPQGVLCGDFR